MDAFGKRHVKIIHIIMSQLECEAEYHFQILRNQRDDFVKTVLNKMWLRNLRKMRMEKV